MTEYEQIRNEVARLRQMISEERRSRRRNTQPVPEPDPNVPMDGEELETMLQQSMMLHRRRFEPELVSGGSGPAVAVDHALGFLRERDVQDGVNDDNHLYRGCYGNPGPAGKSYILTAPNPDITENWWSTPTWNSLQNRVEWDYAWLEMVCGRFSSVIYQPRDVPDIATETSKAELYDIAYLVTVVFHYTYIPNQPAGRADVDKIKAWIPICITTGEAPEFAVEA